MIAIVLCASCANVINEKIFANKRSMPIMFQNLQLYTFGIAFNLFNWYYSVAYSGKPWIGDVGNSPHAMGVP